VASPRQKPAGTVHLLDGNVLYALIDQSHVHHAAARQWFLANPSGFATCPITQGTLVRLAMHVGNQTVQQAINLLSTVTSHTKHHFWVDSVQFSQVRWNGVMGHRQVTDAYLAGLARKHRGKLATFDKGLVALHADVGVALKP
jgi:toxin-antitoxin system PIN domain toxin